MRSTFMSALFFGALVASQPGCVVESDEAYAPAPDPGTLTINYTMEGVVEPSLCGYYGVDYAELIVYTTHGHYVTSEHQRCGDFYVSTNLYPGDYIANVTLVDRADRARSLTKPLAEITIFSGVELVIDLDFPADSML